MSQMQCYFSEHFRYFRKVQESFYDVNPFEGNLSIHVAKAETFITISDSFLLRYIKWQ